MLEDLEQAAERVPAEERTPELLQLLEFKQCMEACEGHFRAVGKRLKAAQAGGDSSPPVGDIEADTQPDDVFQGLVQFVRAVALGAEAAGVGLCSGEALSLLKESLLQPLISKGEDGTYQAHRPSVVCPQPTPTNVVQLLAAGVFLHVTGNPEAGVAMLSAALSGVWPPSRELQRRLVGGQFVPTAAVAAKGLGKKTAADSTAAETAGGDGGTETQAFAAGVGSNVTGTGTGTGPTSPQAQPATDASSSAANEATSGSPEAAADTADASSGGAGSEPRTPYAQALSEALERCGAGVSEAQLHKSALVLRLFLGCRAVGEQAAAAQKSGGGSASLGPSFQAILRSLLLDCQQLLDLDPSCMHAYVWAAQLVLYAKWPLDPARVAALLREGGQRAKAARCWLAAGEVQHDHALWLLNSAAEERNVAVRHASLLEAGQLLDGVKDMEGRLKGWMPAGRLDQLAERRQQLSGLLLKLQAGHLRSLGAVRPVAGLPSGGPACSFCGAAASHLKTCAACKAVGYCSRGCQVKDWKLGHRQRCSELAAAAAASGAGQATPAAAGGES